jgi:subtilisin family serine protease
MRPRPLAWILLSVVCFAAAIYCWRLGDRWAARQTAAPAPLAHHLSPVTHHPSPAALLPLLSQAGTLNAPPLKDSPTNQAPRATNQFALRLSNTTTPIGQLQRNDQAILLENALVDTTRPVPSIPDHLRAQGDPGSYIVQARGPINDAFRSLLQTAGASIVSYIPNNAYLVRASAAVARQLQAAPQTQAVLPFEPYYKLKLSLLKLAVEQKPLPDNTALNVLLFADGREATRAALQDLGATVVGDEESSPFGPVLTVVPPAGGLPALAGLPGVQEVEWSLVRASANDFSRVRVGVATDIYATNNYLRLTGTNVMVNINDSGVDATHPDLAPRVFGDSTNALVDPNGHGTHVAGIIASSGGQSGSVSNASGPNGLYTGTNNQFRGKAPAANLFALPVGMFTQPMTDGGTLSWPSDTYLQETAARTNAFISNNSWSYVGPGAGAYDIHAASYDAAVRDALPRVSGSRPLLYVFSAGNAGGGNSDGTAGNPDTILSPGTAKNVITVGAIEQLRNITNQVWKCSVPSDTNSCATNQPWLSMTDANDQVAAFSSRGPVGVGIEGDSGRFKPDLVAPGTFVISTRSAQWDTNAYYNPTSHITFIFQNIVVPTNMMYLDSIFIPANAVQFSLSVSPNTNSPVPFPKLQMFVKQTGYPTNVPPLGTNDVSVPPTPGNLQPVDAYWFYGISNRTAQPVVCDLITDIMVTNDLGNYLQVLEGMNDSLGGLYRYESGTSMAAADVSGTLALMQEFFEQRLGRTNSPALMKALLINGARSVGNLYDFQVAASVVSQGWGLINLTNTLPIALNTNLAVTTNTMVMVDQSPTNALATGQSRTYKISLSSAARTKPLRVTLVWTDPPGNPIASVKLVNDLDLVITNLDITNVVYFGNDITAGNDFNQKWNTTNLAANIDSVNNVENIFLSPTLSVGQKLSTNYSITVTGHRVNVNAVTAQTNNVCQDYALVISCGDGITTNAITFDTSSVIVSSNVPLVIVITNSFINSPGFSGGILFNQRVGASPQLLGTNTLILTNDANAVITLGVTNQWHFYFITNEDRSGGTFTNAAFLTFLPANLAVPRMGVFEPTATLATRPQADIDLYVAPPSIPNNLALTNLDPAVLAATTKSLSRGGTETIVLSNAIKGVYCVGVQSQDQQAAEYAILGVFSELPFGTSDSNGVHLVGIPLFQPIPDGSPQMPGVATIMAVNVDSMKVRRVIVTNVVNHELMGDLLGNLNNGTFSSVLNNHTCVIDPTTTPPACQTLTSYIFDDSSEHNVGPDSSLFNPHVTHTDGPGDLGIFGGRDGVGQWMLSMVDNATNHVGTNIGMAIFLERQQDLTGGGITVTIQGSSCRDDFIDVPANATSLTIDIVVKSGNNPVNMSLELCPLGGGDCKSTLITNAVGGSLTLDDTDLPPLLVATTYRVRTCNLDTAPITVNIRATFGFSLNTIRPILSTNTVVPVPILDDAVTDVFLTNSFHKIVTSLDVGLLITDPRISDLAITLISPHGTRVLLFENRGAASTNGLGTFNLTTNFLMTPFYTNNFDLAPVGLYATGAVFQTWNVVSNFVDVLDDYTCLCLSNHILALLDGSVTNTLPTTNSVPPTNANPYTLTFKVNHLPWLEGMVTWWPLDVDGSDIFGGFNGLLLGDVAFSTGQTSAFLDNCAGPGVNPMWQPGLPSVVNGAGPPGLVEVYKGIPNATFTTIGGSNVMRLQNTLSPWTRKGWSSATTFHGQNFRYEVRFNTLTQGTPTSIDGFIEIWIIDAANSNRFDIVAPDIAFYGSSQLFIAGSSIDNSYHQMPFNNFQNNTWYRLVLSAAPNQGVRAAVLNDAGTELVAVSFTHTAAAFPSGFKLGLSQFMGSPSGPSLTDVAVDYARLTSGLAGEVNQAYFGDGVATRMIVPRCPELDLGARRGLSIEGWINPFNITNPAPLVEWYDPAPPTNQPSLGVQFWLSLTNGPGSLGAIIWDTNLQPHIITTFTNALTNAGWQHVALTYDTNSGRAALYVNGLTTNNTPLVVTNLGHFVPRTSGDVYLGWDPSIVPPPINYSNFSSTAGLTLVGSAVRNGAVLRLTPAAANNTGNAWAQKKQPCAAGFDTHFEFQISSPGNQGGDGVMFSVQNNAPALLGYPPIGVSVFFNTTWANNSVDILTNSVAFTRVNSPSGIILDDGAVHLSRIIFDGTGLSVWLDGHLIFTNVPVAAGMASAVDATGKAWVGFTGYCGASYENHDLLSWTFGGPVPGTSFQGGLDEFSLYNRALSPCEVNAIFKAGPRGKYGTNVLVCPVTTEVTLLNTTAGNQIFTFTNGVTWTNNGPHWETNTIAFSTPSTNPTPIIVRGLNPYSPIDTNAPNNLNVVVDDFVLSELVPQVFDGLLHFTEDTNLAVLPIKFAPAPYAATNFPPVLIFSNDFSQARRGLYQLGATILGGTNSPALGLRNWTVTNGTVTVVSNAFLDVATTNWLAMATGAVQCLLPTSPGHRYQLSYSLRGPCAVGWWNGSVDPLSQRAQDLISGNDGAFFFGATNVQPGFVGAQGFSFDGPFTGPYDDPDIFFDKDIDDPANKIELADPPQLRFTNAFTLEGWIKPALPNPPGPGFEFICPDQQIFFRGYPEPLDCRGQGDPYWLALEPSTNLTQWDIHFHIAEAHFGAVGADVLTTNGPIVPGGGSNSGWWHIAAVFDKPFTNIVVVNGTNFITITTNALRLYVNGVCVASNYTTLSPYQDLDPAFSPGVTIGGRCGYDWTQPYTGFMDEVTAYARALTEPEIAAIAAAGTLGKADASAPVSQSLAKLSVAVDNAQLGVAYGDNSQWSAHTVEFTALDTNAVLTLQSLLPGTLLHGVTLTEVPPELFYLPEVALSDIYGEDAFGIWTLEIWDNRIGPTTPTTNGAQLIEWQLNLGFAPSNPPPVIDLAHGIPYTNSLAAYGIQYFVVQVPQWADWATNILEFAHQVRAANPLPVTVLFNQTNFPTLADLPLIGPLSAGTNTLATNGVPPLLTGQSYYLALTNPNPVGVTFALGVWFDITTLTNCQMLVSNVVGVPGIPRYFQFDVPTNGTLAPASVSFWLSDAPCNLKVVLSEHLPLPDLNHFDYTSQVPCTNNQIIMLVTNSTPFPIQTNRWYVGVFYTGPTTGLTNGATNATFSVQACSAPLYPLIIPLTNGIPFVVADTNNPFTAPPGPPQMFFFDFLITNSVPGVLFELYNLSGDADLVLQQAVPPTMAPYFDTSSFTGTNSEQIVLRTDPTLSADASVPDLRGHWYLGVYNNEQTNVTYTIRATWPNANGILKSGLPLRRPSVNTLTLPRGQLVTWQSIVGEHYFVQFSTIAAGPYTNVGFVTATTPLTTFEVLPPPGNGFFQTIQVFSFQPVLKIQLSTGNQVRISWSTAYQGYTLQSELSLSGGVWVNAGLSVGIEGNENAAYDTIGPVQKYYRLIK